MIELFTFLGGIAVGYIGKDLLFRVQRNEETGETITPAIPFLASPQAKLLKEISTYREEEEKELDEHIRTVMN